MCYTILYKRLFVRLPDDTLIGLVLSGDSNVYYEVKRTPGFRSRTRSWFSWNFKPEVKRSYTEEEISSWLSMTFQKRLLDTEAFLKDFDAQGTLSPEKELRARFGFYASKSLYGRSPRTTTWAAFRRFFEDGVRQAIPWDSFVNLCHGVYLEWYEDNHYFHSKQIFTPEQLAEEWDKFAGLKPWIIPSSTYDADHAADAASCVCPGKRNVSFLVGFTDRDGTRRKSYVKTLFPLTFTDESVEAGKFNRSLLRDISSIDLIENLMPGINVSSVSYQH